MISTRSPRSIGLALLVSVGAFGASSCGGVVQVNEYGDALKKNFVTACTTSVSIENNVTKRTELAPVSACNCAYRLIKDVYKLSVDDLKAYEEKVADAKQGAIPDPPDALNKALADVQKAFGGGDVQGPTQSACAQEQSPAPESSTTAAPK